MAWCDCLLLCFVFSQGLLLPNLVVVLKSKGIVNIFPEYISLNLPPKSFM